MQEFKAIQLAVANAITIRCCAAFARCMQRWRFAVCHGQCCLWAPGRAASCACLSCCDVFRLLRVYIFAQELQKDVQLELEAARKFLERIEGQASQGWLSWLPFKLPFLSK